MAVLIVVLGLVAVRPRVRVSVRRSVAVTVQITAQWLVRESMAGHARRLAPQPLTKVI